MSRYVVGKNALMLGLGNLLGRGLGIILYILLARYLGPENYGVYNIAVSFIQIFVLLTNFGLDVVYIRSVARDRKLASSYFYSGALVKIVLFVASFAILFTAVNLLSYSKLVVIAVAVFGLSIVFQALSELMSSAFKAAESMEYVSYNMVLRSLLALSFVWCLVLGGKGVIAMLLAQDVSYFLVVLVFYLVLVRRGLIELKFSGDYSVCIQMTKMSLPFVFIGVLHVVNFRADIIMLSLLGSETLAGYYSAVNELIISLYMLPTVLATALFPTLAKYFEKDSKGVTQISTLSTKVLITIGVPMGIGIFILSPEIVDVILGEQYKISVVTLKILSIGVGFTYGRLMFSWVLTAINLEKHALREYALCLLFNVILNAVLIPKYGIEGAAIATVGSALVGNTYLYIQLKRALPGFAVFRSYLKPFICGGIMALVVTYIAPMNLFILVFAGVISYLGAGVIFRMFPLQEYGALMKGLKVS